MELFLALKFVKKREISLSGFIITHVQLRITLKLGLIEPPWDRLTVAPILYIGFLPDPLVLPEK